MSSESESFASKPDNEDFSEFASQQDETDIKQDDERISRLLTIGHDSFKIPKKKKQQDRQVRREATDSFDLDEVREENDEERDSGSSDSERVPRDQIPELKIDNEDSNSRLHTDDDREFSSSPDHSSRRGPLPS